MSGTLLFLSLAFLIMGAALLVTLQFLAVSAALILMVFLLRYFESLEDYNLPNGSIFVGYLVFQWPVTWPVLNSIAANKNLPIELLHPLETWYASLIFQISVEVLFVSAFGYIIYRVFQRF